MNWKISDKHYFWNLISASIMLVGLVSAIAIYTTAQDESDSVSGYRIIGDKIYPVAPAKTYVHNLELYGGKAAVLADGINRWFEGLWYGKSLAVTIACLSIITAGLIFFFNNYLFFDEETEEHTE